MLRKSLFWGLTLMLVAVLAWLVIRSRREEKLQAAKMVEIVKESKPSTTRVLSPQDLAVVEAGMTLASPEGGAEAKTKATAHHQVAIRNTGSTEYVSVTLRFNYLGRGDRLLGSKTCIVDKPLPAGQTVSLGDISVEEAPAAAVDCKIQIIAADFK